MPRPTRKNILIFIVCLLLGGIVGSYAAKGAEKSRVFVNWCWPDYYVPHGATKNAVLTSEYPWKVVGGGPAASRDAQGWPLQDFQVTIFADVPDQDGPYTLIFRGRPGVKVEANPGGTVGALTTGADGLTRGVVDVKGPTLILKFRGTVDGVRDFKLLRPGYADDSGVWTDSFKDFMRKFGGGRSMDWLRSNTSTVVEWKDRCLPSDPQWSNPAKGGPWEPYLDLYREIGGDIWPNVPPHASDDYIDQWSRMVAERMKGTAGAIYPEWGNELWNTGEFAPAKWLYEVEARRLKKSRYRVYADRLVLIGDTLKKYIDRPERIRPMLCYQAADSAEMKDAIGYIESTYGAGRVWGVAGALYMGENRTEKTADAIANGLKSQGQAWSRGEGNTISGLPALLAWCKAHNLELAGYEGNVVSARGGNQAIIDERIKAHTLQATGDAVPLYGGALLKFERIHCAFTSFHKPGASGHWQIRSSPMKDTPKSLAWFAFAAANKWNDPYTPPEDEAQPPPVVIDPPPIIDPPVEIPPVITPPANPPPVVIPGDIPAELRDALARRPNDVRISIESGKLTARILNPSPVKDVVYDLSAKRRP